MRPSNVYETYYLGEFKVADDELSEHQLATFSTTFTNDDQFQCYLCQLKTRQQIKHEHMVRLMSVSHHSKSSWCSNTYTVESTYEYFSDSLQKEIASRKARMAAFTSQEILRIAYDLLDVLAFLQTSNILNNSIVPSLVFLWDDVALGVKRAKLIERLSTNKSKKTNLVSAMAAGLEVYPDPTFYEWHIKTDKPLQSLNPYNLGLCLLEAGLLESVQGIYNHDAGKFRPEVLETLIQKFARRYSAAPVLVSLVQRSLGMDHNARPDFLKLKAEMPEWFALHVPQIGKLGSLATTTPRSRKHGLPFVVIEDFSTHEVDGRESTKEEILEFFNLTNMGQLKDMPAMADRSHSTPERPHQSLPLQTKDSQISRGSTERKVIRDTRKNEREDMFETNGIERFYQAETGGFYKNNVQNKLEMNEKGQNVVRTYVTYCKITDPLEEEEARRYVESRRIKGERSRPPASRAQDQDSSSVFDVTLDMLTDYNISKVDLTYSINESAMGPASPKPGDNSLTV